MSDQKKAKKPVPAGFVRFLTDKEQAEGRKVRLVDLEFPTLDDMEMDVPFLGSHVRGERGSPEDESDVEMQCLIHCNPTLAVSSLSL